MNKQQIVWTTFITALLSVILTIILVKYEPIINTKGFTIWTNFVTGITIMVCAIFVSVIITTVINEDNDDDDKEE